MMRRDGKFVLNRKFLGRFLRPYAGDTSIFVDGLLARN
jgi:hypothetical protein